MRTLGFSTPTALLSSSILQLFLLGGHSRAQQQPPPAKCDPTTGFNWAFNSKNQSPCDIASSLGGVCNNGIFNVPALNDTQMYLGPTTATANACRCNTVFYSLLSACAACQAQDRVYLKWSDYDANCSISYKNFPMDIPSGTAVPNWAYIDVTQSNTFDPDVAKGLAMAGGPESTGTASPTSTLPSPSTSVTSQSSQDSSGSNNTGAIAGGVIGGVVGVGIIAVLTFWFFRRRSRNTRSGGRRGRGSSFDINAGSLPPPLSSTRNNPTSDISSTSRVASPYTMVSGSAPRLYNPSDPSTFPNAMGMQPNAQTGTLAKWQTQAPGAMSQHHRSQSAESVIPPRNAGIYSTPSHRRDFSGSGSYAGVPEL